MSLYRYLLYISYIGKPFRGAQRQVRVGLTRPDDPSTVQGCLEMGLRELNPCNDPIVVLSSRTDAGVHALSSTCHVDLFRRNGMIYNPRTVTICLNKFFNKQDLPIRVFRTYIVPSDFHCRHKAISRTYLYRVVVTNTDGFSAASHLNYLPIEEWDRCLFYCTDTFDVDAMRRAAKLFEGYHDFRSFMGQHLGHLEKVTRREIFKVDIFQNKKNGYSSYSWPSSLAINAENYKFIDIYIKAKGFLYKQVQIDKQGPWT